MDFISCSRYARSLRLGRHRHVIDGSWNRCAPGCKAFLAMHALQWNEASTKKHKNDLAKSRLSEMKHLQLPTYSTHRLEHYHRHFITDSSSWRTCGGACRLCWISPSDYVSSRYHPNTHSKYRRGSGRTGVCADADLVPQIRAPEAGSAQDGNGTSLRLWHRHAWQHTTCCCSATDTRSAA